MLEIYHWEPNANSGKPLLAALEKGVAYTSHFIDMLAFDQHKPEYLAINPKSRVPALVTERGVLTETPAILAFIAQSFPEAGLAPADPFDFARMQAFNSYLCATVHVAHAHKHRGYRWADQESFFADMTAKVAQNEIAIFRLIEEAMFQGPWVLGEAFSVCDAYLFTPFGWLPGDGVDVAQFPTLLDHSHRVAERPAVRKVLALQGT